MKELVEKFQKMSAAQLINKMDRGVENEAEKNIIIQILQKRGKDVTPYVGKTAEEIKAEAALDAAQIKGEKASGKSKKVILPRIEGESHEKYLKPKEIYFDHKVFKKGTKVRILNSSSKVQIGETGEITKVGYYEGREGKFFVYVNLDKGGSCSRNMEFVELV